MALSRQDENDILAYLAADPRVVSATLYDANISVPDLATLLGSTDALLFTTDSGQNSANDVVLGNLMADYVDAGRGLLLSTFTWNDPSNIGISGRVMTSGYSPFISPGTQGGGGVIDLNASNTLHPALANVHSFAAQYDNHAVTLDVGASMIAVYTDSALLLAENASGNVLGLSAFPSPGTSRGSIYLTGDYAVLVVNSLAYATGGTGSHHVTVDPDTDVFDVDFGNQLLLPGDYNADGYVDRADYTVWRNSLGQTGFAAYSGADGNGNGLIDKADYSVWKAHFGETRVITNLNVGNPIPLAGDYNSDGSVDRVDYTVWRNSLGQSGFAAYSGADGNGDSVVDKSDYSIWKSHFGETLLGTGGGSGSQDTLTSSLVATAGLRTESAEIGTALADIGNLDSTDVGELSRVEPVEVSRVERVADESIGISGLRTPASRRDGARRQLFAETARRLTLRDDALVAWLASRADDAWELGDSSARERADDWTADDSSDSFANAVDEALESLLAEAV